MSGTEPWKSIKRAMLKLNCAGVAGNSASISMTAARYLIVRQWIAMSTIGTHDSVYWPRVQRLRMQKQSMPE
jgi:hypothetical protein